MKMKIFTYICMAVFVMIMSSQAYSKEIPRVAKVVELEGEVEAKLSGQENWVPVQKNMILNQGDIIKTKSKSFALIILNGSGETSEIEISENSQLLILELMTDDKDGAQTTLLDLAIGKVLIRAKELHNENSKFEIKTPTSVVGVRGTTFSVEVEALE
ncbi:FecR domain-containing protein [PVC group bacterium]|nr:FecR domain-containing protein [PVC group bacterium]